MKLTKQEAAQQILNAVLEHLRHVQRKNIRSISGSVNRLNFDVHVLMKATCTGKQLAAVILSLQSNFDWGFGVYVHDFPHITLYPKIKQDRLIAYQQTGGL